MNNLDDLNYVSQVNRFLWILAAMAIANLLLGLKPLAAQSEQNSSSPNDIDRIPTQIVVTNFEFSGSSVFSLQLAFSKVNFM